MRRIVAIFFTTIFLSYSMGIAINSHFCGKKLQSVGLLKHGCCCKKGAKMPKDCCKDETKFVKITDDYSASSQLHVEKPDFSSVIINAPFLIKFSEDLVIVPLNNHSPPLPVTDRVIAFHSILI